MFFDSEFRIQWTWGENKERQEENISCPLSASGDPPTYPLSLCTTITVYFLIQMVL
jgi:hypothetical protein